MNTTRPEIPKTEDVRFSPNQKLPPGYRVVYSDDHTLWLAPDEQETEGLIHWNRFASYRGAWAHYRAICKEKQC